MKKFLVILFLALTLNTNAFADNMIVLKCKKYTQDYLAVIDLENKLFDMNPFSAGIPDDFRFKITEANDKRIIASAIKTSPEKSGGFLKHQITITIDRYMGVIKDSAELIEDTRKDKSNPSWIFAEFFAEDCKKVNLEKKF